MFLFVILPFDSAQGERAVLPYMGCRGMSSLKGCAEFLKTFSSEIECIEFGHFGLKLGMVFALQSWTVCYVQCFLEEATLFFIIIDKTSNIVKPFTIPLTSLIFFKNREFLYQALFAFCHSLQSFTIQSETIVELKHPEVGNFPRFCVIWGKCFGMRALRPRQSFHKFKLLCEAK